MTSTAPSAPGELEGAGTRGRRLGHGFDPLEVGGGERGELGGRERAAVAALASRRASGRAPTAPRASVPGRLSRRIEQTTIQPPAAPPEAAAAASRRRRGCALRPRSRAASPRRSRRPGSAIASARAGRRRGRGTTRRPRSRARGCCAVTTTAPAPFCSASSRHSGSASTTVQPGWTTASFSARDRLARVAEHVHVVERDVREDDDARVEDVRRVVPSAEARPRRPRRRRPSSAKSTSAAAVSTSNCVAPSDSAAGRTAAIAASKSASSPSTRIRSLQPRTCGER